METKRVFKTLLRSSYRDGCVVLGETRQVGENLVSESSFDLRVFLQDIMELKDEEVDEELSFLSLDLDISNFGEEPPLESHEAAEVIASGGVEIPESGIEVPEGSKAVVKGGELHLETVIYPIGIHLLDESQAWSLALYLYTLGYLGGVENPPYPLVSIMEAIAEWFGRRNTVEPVVITDI